jgi:hypothetical protein
MNLFNTNKFNLKKVKTTKKIEYNIKKNTTTQLPNDFMWKTYILLNNDLQYINEEYEAITHYLNHGINEGRSYKITDIKSSNDNINLPKEFHWETYIYLNNDLSYINDYKTAITHYLNYGINEGRSYKININNQLFPYVGIYDNIDYSLKKYMFNVNNVEYDTIWSNELLNTVKYYSNHGDLSYLKYKVHNDILNKINEFILVLDFPNGGGGTTFFLNTLISKYKYKQTFVIARCYDDIIKLNINEEYDLIQTYNVNESIAFLDKYNNIISKIFINHLLSHSSLFINKINSLNIEKIVITHDYHNICKKTQPYYHEIENNYIEPLINPDIIITQNEVNIYTFSKSYKKNMLVVDIPDYKYSNELIQSNNDKIVVAIIGNIIDIKGEDILKKIYCYYKNNSNVRIIVIGMTSITNFNDKYHYNSIDEFNDILKTHKPNIIIELSLWPETYSYTLTLSMLTKLPIIYLKKEFVSVVEDRLSKYDKAYSFKTLNDLNNLIKTKSQSFLYTILPVIYFNSYWRNLLITKRECLPIQNYNNKYKNNIKPYFIYFPQFHKIPENDIFFYKNFSDIHNLKLYNNNSIKLETPLLSYLNIDNIEDYNLINVSIIQKQVNLINYYGFSGIAIYYYWFTTNNITNNNMIMNKVIDIFFNNINMGNTKVFFIWANENWTNNKAFGINSQYIIENTYDNDSFLKNSETLIQYFKNENYLKIDNKPVFFIYHNYLIDNIDIFYNILNNKCISNGFNGLHLILNSFEYINTNYPHFYINFNYKKYLCRYIDNNQYKIDYYEYLNNDYHVNRKCIQTIVTDFNNKPRLCKPNRLEHSTSIINNSEINKILFIQKLIDSYNRDNKTELDNILLINSFNEWGENMAFEPSEEYQYYYLNLLYSLLQ